jgi:hypothetical protein
MKKSISLLLLSSLALGACGSDDSIMGEAEPFDVYAIEDCSDYITYLKMDVESSAERGSGRVENITCTGTVDYNPDDNFELGLIVEHEEYESMRIGLAELEGEDYELYEMHGETISFTGHMDIQVLDDSGARIWVSEDDL